MDNLTINKIKDLLEASENIGIAIGRDPGVDEMAAALSLYLVLTAEGKKVTIASPTDPLVEVSSLVGIDKIKKGFDGEGEDLTVSFPYKEGEIEKISYTLEDGKLNILVKAGAEGLSFDENNIEYKRGGGAPKLIFVVGTRRLSDLGKIFNPEDLKDSKVVNIDYSGTNQGFGDISLVDKNMSSVSEMIASLLSSMGFKFDMDIASNLMSGIIAGTENFQSPRTSSTAFEMTAVLMRNGAVRQTAAKKTEMLQGDDAYSFFTPTKQPKKAEPMKTPFIKRPTVEPKDDDNPPDDWLAPKIYKGSTTI